ncbi:MAG: hypothetical protein MJ252_21910 [archaeon]|nr:hypothetical protein [archaeon]
MFSYNSNGIVFHLIILLDIYLGIVSIDEFSPTKNNMKKVIGKDGKVLLSLYNKNYLSEINIDSKNRNSFTDSDTFLKLNVKNYKDKILQRYPTFILSHSRMASPYLIYVLKEMLNNFNKFNIQLEDTFEFDRGVKSVELDNIYLHKIDIDALEQRKEDFDDDLLDKMSKKISPLLFSDFFDFNFSLNAYFEGEKKEMDMLKHSELQFFDFSVADKLSFIMYFKLKNLGQNIIVNDPENKINFYFEKDPFMEDYENKIWEFYSLVLELQKIKQSKDMKEITEDQVPKNKGISPFASKQKFRSTLDSNNYSATEKKNREKHKFGFIETPERSFNNLTEKKGNLKPFNKDEILLQDSCEVDYGSQPYSSKEEKQRKKALNKRIAECNKNLIHTFDNDVINSSFQESCNTSTVAFNLPDGNVDLFKGLKGNKNKKYGY